MKKKFLVLFFIFIISSSAQAKTLEDKGVCEHSKNAKAVENNNNNSFKPQKLKKNDAIYLTIKQNLPESLNEQRKVSLDIMLPYFQEKPVKITVVWQLDEYSYGKSYSLSRVYIEDYLKKKTTAKNLMSVLNSEDILPVSNRFNIPSIKQCEVSTENMLKAAELKKAADLYYLEGKIDEAQRIYLRTLHFNPNDYISLFRLGEIYKNKNKTKEAENYFIKSLEINPEFSAADKALCDIRKIN